jgi:lambda family phage tail tape measure protein
MAVIADLVIKVDTSELDKANRALAEFNTVQNRASAATETASKSQERASRASKTQVDDINRHMASLVNQKKSIDSVAAAQEKAAQRQNAALQSTISSLSPIERGMANYAKQVKNLDTGLANGALSQERYNILLDRAKQKLESLAGAKQFDPTKGLEQAETEFRRFTSSIDAASKITASYENKLRDADKYLASGKLTQEQYTEAVERATAARERALQRTGAGITAQEREAKAIRDLKNAIDPTNRELERIIQLEKQLEVARTKGIGGTRLEQQEYEKLSKTLAASRTEFARRTADQDRLGLSAKQLKASLQGVPAQFTDIFVSLQGGQNPLTVFLQQGGQLKDMFGGIAPAAKALGGYVLGLITPFTVAAAAAGALFVSYLKVNNESSELNKALISTRGAAGITADSVNQLASSFGALSVTEGKAVGALTSIAATGKVLSENLAVVTQAALDLERFGGVAIEDAIADFASLGKDPAEAALRLDEKYKFLTATIYSQITALQRQGDFIGATALAQQELARVSSETSAKIEADATRTTKLWIALKSVISEGIDFVPSVVRGLINDDDLTTQLDDVNKKLTDRLALNQRIRDGIQDPEIRKNARQDRDDPEVQRLNLERKAIEEKIAAQKKAAEDERKLEQDRVKDVNNRVKLEAAAAASRTVEDSARSEIGKLTEARTLSVKLGTWTPNEQAQFESAIKYYEKQIEDASKKTEGSLALDNTGVNDIKNQIREISEAYKTRNTAIDLELANGVVSQQQAVAKRKQLIEEEKNVTIESYNKQIAELERLKEGRSVSTAQLISLDRQISDARTNLAKASEEAEQRQNKVDAAERERLRKREQVVANYTSNLKLELDNIRKAGERSVAALGQTANESALAGELGAQDDAYQKEIRSLNERQAANEIDAEQYAELFRARTEAHNEFTQAVIDNYDKQRAAEADFVTGAGAGFRQYIENGQNASDLTKNAVVGAFNSMEDALATFVTTGKLDFRSLTVSILSDLAKTAAKIAASKILTSLLGAFFSGGAGTPGSASFVGPLPQAKGGAWSGGTQFFAKGGAFTNSVVSKPTAFGMQGGLGVMGEAGPEAILPLSRTADGSLGVKAIIDYSNLPTASAGGGVAVVVNISGEGGAQTDSTAGYEQFGKDIGDFVDQRYQQLISRDLRQGGLINRAIHG